MKGTPTDCIIMGVRKLMADNPPDLILAGVNRGQNVAEDVTYSGTIAGAMEGTLLGFPSLALSQCYSRDAWPLLGLRRAHAPGLIARMIVEKGLPPGVLDEPQFPCLSRRRRCRGRCCHRARAA